MAQRNVNRPTDVARRDQTINQKLQLYGIYCAFAQGKLPSNDQIDIALNSALQSRALTKPSNRLSDEGHKLVDDLADVIEKAKILLLSKNQGQLIQQFIWNVNRTGRSFGQDGKLKSEKTQGPVSKETAQQDGQNALEGLKQLAKLIVSNGQFRKLLSDATILARSMVGDAATGIASRVHPSEEQLSQIDTPAEDNSWVEAPNFDQSDFKSRVKSQYSKASSWTKKKRPDSSTSGTAVADGATDDLTLPDDGATVSSSSSRRKEWGGKAKEYWDKKMPAERQDATMDRLRKMIVEIQGHDDYQNAIVTLLNLLDTYGSHGRHYSNRGVGQVQGVYQSDEIQAAEKNLKTLIERFANSTSMDDFIDAVKKIQECAKSDPELRNWLQSLNTYFRRCLQETGYVIQPEAKEEWRVLSDHGQQLAQHKYRPEFKRLSYEAQSFVKHFDADQTNKAFGQSVQKLCLDLGQDENGKPKFKPHLVKDLTNVIIPAFLEHLHYVPLPRMEYSDKMIDLIVENLIIESDNLTPNVLEIKSDNHWRWGRSSVTGGNKNKFLLNIAGIQMDLRDVSYYVKRKTGFPKITDTGLMDIFLGGNGLSVLIELETADRFSPTSKAFGDDNGLSGGAHYFKASQVKVNLSTLKIKVRKSNHKFLIAIMKPILLRLLKPIVTRIAANEAKKAIAELDEIVSEIRTEAKRAKEVEKKLAPEDRGKQATYSRYAELVKNRYQTNKEAKAKVNETKTGDSKFQFVMTQDQTMFPNITLPAGISSKTMQYRSMADQGTEWQSPVFKIGNARPTAAGKIPTPPKIVRKSTWTGYKDPKLNDPNATNKAGLSSKLDNQGVGRGQGTGTTMNPQDVRRQPLQEVDNEQGLPMDRQTYQRATDPNYAQMGGNGGGLSKENGGDNRYHRDSKMDKNLGSRDALHPSQGYYHNPNQDMNLHGDHGDNLSQPRPYDMPSYHGQNTKVPAAYDGTNGNGGNQPTVSGH